MSSRFVRLAPWLVVVATTSLATAGLVWALEPEGAPPTIVDGALLVVDREALATVDLQLVHEELIPDWVVSSGGLKRLHFDRIRREAGKDPNLGALLDRMKILFEADPVLNASELLALVRVWNTYLGKAGEPWRLAGEVRIGGDGGELFLKSYRVIVDDGRVRVGNQTFRAEIRRRVDQTTLVDAWLGHMHDHSDGVVVLLDRVAGFTLDQVWLLLDPVLDAELDPVSRAFAPAVRAEIGRQLAPAEMDALQRTAEDRYQMNRAANVIHGRHQCGSAFYVSRVPWNGMSHRDVATLQMASVGSESVPCPDVTENEWLLFAARSSHLRQTAELQDALEHLIGFVSQAVVVHEARHAADDALLAGQPISCVGCPEGISHVAALEGSAYLASFADPQHGALSLYQACALDPEWVPDRVAMVSFLSEKLGGSCSGGPPAELPARAQELEREIFGRSAPIEVLDFPASLPVGVGGGDGVIVALLACRVDPTLAAYGGWPLWVDLDLTDAVALGHRPTLTDLTPPGPLSFVDQAAERGLADVVGGGNQHGVGVGLVDLDADGWVDLVVANGVSNVTGEEHPSRLLWNQGDGTFVDGTDGLGGALVGRDLYSVAAGDLDNDGDVDLYLGGQPTDVFLANQGDRTFVDRSVASGAAGPPSDPKQVADGRGKVVSIGDVDRDGWQDLVSATSTRPNPGVALLHNRGDGTFEDWTEATGVEIASEGNPCAVMFSDYDNDGFRDLWIWNDRGGHVLLHHDGAMGYENFQNSADRTSTRNPMGIDAADTDHDGDLDYYVSNIGSHPFLVNQGDGTFVDRTDLYGTIGEFGWGLAFEDFDLDSWTDLYVAQEDERPTLVYRNLRGILFGRTSIDVPDPLNNGAAHNVAAAVGDVDRDGRVDVVTARTDGSPILLHHGETDAGGRHWLEVRVDDTPETGERGGIGARVVVKAGDLVQFRDLTGGASRASQSELSARFGLDGWDGAEWVLVVWPDGRTRAYTGVTADDILVIR